MWIFVLLTCFYCSEHFPLKILFIYQKKLMKDILITFYFMHNMTMFTTDPVFVFFLWKCIPTCEQGKIWLFLSLDLAKGENALTLWCIDRIRMSRYQMLIRWFLSLWLSYVNNKSTALHFPVSRLTVTHTILEICQVKSKIKIKTKVITIIFWRDFQKINCI